MDIQNKEYLIDLLNFSLQLPLYDEEIFSTIMKLKSYPLEEEDATVLEDNLRPLIDNGSVIKNSDFLLRVINELDFIDQTYFVESIEFNNIVNLNPDDTAALSEFVNRKLDSQLVFKNKNNEYNYYRNLVSCTINIKNRELIQKAITKIQSL